MKKLISRFIDILEFRGNLISRFGVIISKAYASTGVNEYVPNMLLINLHNPVQGVWKRKYYRKYWEAGEDTSLMQHLNIRAYELFTTGGCVCACCHSVPAPAIAAIT